MAYRAGDVARFNEAVARWSGSLEAEGAAQRVAAREAAFNRYAPFSKGMALYLAALLLACASWMFWPKELARAGFYLMALAFAAHTGGLLARILIHGRPPVTNLYSSAVFVGWTAAAVGLFLERLRLRGLATVVASAAGFAALIIAHGLAAGGDTMEMMRAVLDSNFWLTTHVVTITMGYGGCYLAGLLAHVYILRGALTPSLDRESALDLSRMTYGALCFALFFSFVGTVLGGIWADQSWGRFWGWDPKENGALLIVLWNALILHARASGLARERGVMVLAVLGNILTSLSWFGVNMLGVGLHSYGFMDKAPAWLALFIFTQLLVAAVGLLPARRWRSGVLT
jgi:ABC-type transport system involved in cytochrome c biogenesis permease subunit